MDKVARAAWVTELMVKLARSFQLQGLKSKNYISVKNPQGEVEVYGTSGNCTLRVARMDSSETPPALVALMKRARDIPYERRRPDEFLGIGIFLDGTMRIEFYACNNRDTVYYPEDIERQVLSQLS